MRVDATGRLQSVPYDADSIALDVCKVLCLGIAEFWAADQFSDLAMTVIATSLMRLFIS